MNRTDVTFSSDRVDCAAWLYRPDGAGPLPLVIMAHGFSCARDSLRPAKRTAALAAKAPRAEIIHYPEGISTSMSVTSSSRR